MSYRGTNRQHRPRAGHMGKNRESWVNVNAHTLILYERVRTPTPPALDANAGEPSSSDEMPDSPDDDRRYYESDDHPEMKLSWSYAGSASRGQIKQLTMTLTRLTAAEIDALREFLMRTLDKARPICAELDALAAQAFKEGDDSFVRLYRPVPQVHVRSGRESEHAASVPLGPDGLAQVGAGEPGCLEELESDPGPEPCVASIEVPDRAQSGLGSDDDSA